MTRPSFWRAYDGLDPRVREAARRAYHLFAENPDHPSLRFKKLGGYEHVWSVRINEQYRAVGERSGDTVTRPCLKGPWPHDGPERAWMRGVATKQYLCTTARSGNEADRPFPAHPKGGLESPHLRRRTGSKGPPTQLSPMLLASEAIPSRREAMGLSDRA